VVMEVMEAMDMVADTVAGAAVVVDAMEVLVVPVVSDVTVTRKIILGPSLHSASFLLY